MCEEREKIGADDELQNAAAFGKFKQYEASNAGFGVFIIYLYIYLYLYIYSLPLCLFACFNINDSPTLQY